jgi:large conductance mechanosensitive channel
MLNEFKLFLLRGKSVDLAVGVIVRAAFGAVVTSLVSDLLTPLISAIVKAPDFTSLSFVINGSKFMYGHFLNALISFILIAGAIFFLVVKPMNVLVSKYNKEPSTDPSTKKCAECLSEIPIEAKRCAHCTQAV